MQHVPASHISLISLCSISELTLAHVHVHAITWDGHVHVHAITWDGHVHVVCMIVLVVL